jgi:hypothetical protein
LKAAYANLVKTAKSGTEDALKRAVQKAIREKTRYAAARITRTEAKRAWADGFYAKIMDNPYVNAVQWRLSSRHPVFDVCDLYAKTNMFGLGAGVFPKDKVPPLPAHPHCLCVLTEKALADFSPAENVRAAGDAWLKKLSEAERVKVLGIEGNKAWMKGPGAADWRDYMRNWRGLENPATRLDNARQYNLLPPTDNFLAALAKERGLPYTGGKEVSTKFYSDTDREVYPSNNGFVGKVGVFKMAGELMGAC